MSTPTVSSAGKSTGKTLTIALILPLTLLIMLPMLFMGLMHSPGPDGVRVAIIGSNQQVGEMVQKADSQAGDQYKVTREGSHDSAKDAIEHREIRAALDPETGDLFHASASGKQVDTVAVQYLQQLAGQNKVDVAQHDVVATGHHDPMATGALFLGLGTILGGMLTGVILSIFPVSHLVRIAAGVAVPLLVTTVNAVMGWAMFDLFDGNAFVSWVTLAALALTACAVSMGLMTLGGFAMMSVNIVLLVMLGITCSGLMMPMDMAPAFYQGMHNVLPTARGMDAFKSAIYFDGNKTVWDWLTMMFWFIGGVGATIGGVVLKNRRRADQESLETEEYQEAAALAGAGVAGAAASA